MTMRLFHYFQSILSATKGLITHYSLLITSFALLFALGTLLFAAAPKAAYAICYCADPIGDSCKCTAFPPASATFEGIQDGVRVLCTTPEEANSTFEKKNPICGSASETIPFCAPVIGNSRWWICYGREFLPSSAVDPRLQADQVPDNSPTTLTAPFTFNGSFGDAGAEYDVYVCDSGAFCCTQPAGVCDDSGVPKGGSCDPQDGPGNTAVCGAISPGPGVPPGVFMGTMCPAGPWIFGPVAYYDACFRGPICDLKDNFWSPGDFIYDSIVGFTVGETEAFGNVKIAPHPYYEEYKGFVCEEGACVRNAPEYNFCEIGAARICTKDISEESCALSGCFFVLDEEYCDDGAVRNCDGDIKVCEDGGWKDAPLAKIGGTCKPPPIKECVGTPGDPYNWLWQDTAKPPNTGRCEDMRANIELAYTPGYTLSFTPHLRTIWENTVKKTQAIFTPFRTRFDKPIEEWPGDSYIKYNYGDSPYDPGPWFIGLRPAGFSGPRAGDPPEINPGNHAEIYFRYLGYLLCARENLIEKLSPLLSSPRYEYYDARCDQELW